MMNEGTGGQDMKTLLGTLAIMMVFTGCLGSIDVGDMGDSSTAVSANATRGQGGGSDPDPDPGEAANWTMLLYLAADNDTEAAAEYTISALAAATASVNHGAVVAFIDRKSVDGTEILEIADGEVSVVQSMPEQDSSDPAVVASFVDFGIANYPDDHFILVVKSEGFGWRGIGKETTHAEEDPDSLMSHGELAGALSGKGIDFLVIESSMTGMIEVAYELRDAADYIAFTETMLMEEGIPHDMVLEAMAQNPDMSPEELGVAYANAHIEFYGEQGNGGAAGNDTSQNFATLSVLRLSQMSALVQAHNAFADVLRTNSDALYNLLPHARDRSGVGTYLAVTPYDFLNDIIAFMDAIQELAADAGESYPDVDAAIADYRAVWEATVVIELQADKFRWVINGLAAWFPPNWVNYDTPPNDGQGQDYDFIDTMDYEDPDLALDFVADGTWLAFLFNYFDDAAGQ